MTAVIQSSSITTVLVVGFVMRAAAVHVVYNVLGALLWIVLRASLQGCIHGVPW